MNLQPNPNMQGIHRQGNTGVGVAGSESWSPLKGFATFSEDGTSAASRAGLLAHPNGLPPIDIRFIEDLQKASFIPGRTIQ